MRVDEEGGLEAVGDPLTTGGHSQIPAADPVPRHSLKDVTNVRGQGDLGSVKS